VRAQRVGEQLADLRRRGAAVERHDGEDARRRSRHRRRPARGEPAADLAGQRDRELRDRADQALELLAPELDDLAVAPRVHRRRAGFVGQQRELADHRAALEHGDDDGRVAGDDVQATVAHDEDALASVAFAKEQVAGGEPHGARLGGELRAQHRREAGEQRDARERRLDGRRRRLVRP